MWTLQHPEGNQVAFKIWKMDIKEYHKKLKVFANFMAGLYSLVLGQCTDALQERLKSHHDFQTANQDGIALLVIIWSLIHTFEENHKLSVLRHLVRPQSHELNPMILRYVRHRARHHQLVRTRLWLLVKQQPMVYAHLLGVNVAK